MKKIISILICAFAVACNNDKKTTDVTTNDTTNNRYDSNTIDNTRNGDTTNLNNNNMTNTGSPFDPADTTFVMKAAMGGMEEVDLGNLASQQAASERVKNFGAMMVRDHTQANNELMSLANGHGMNIASGMALPADMQKDKTNLVAKQGAAFDKAYMNMMVSDHRKDVAEFEKASKNAKDPQLKDFATRTLPTLKTHLDSAIAVQKSLK
jgi:putative membrane protein